MPGKSEACAVQDGRQPMLPAKGHQTHAPSHILESRNGLAGNADALEFPVRSLADARDQLLGNPRRRFVGGDVAGHAHRLDQKHRGDDRDPEAGGLLDDRATPVEVEYRRSQDELRSRFDLAPQAGELAVKCPRIGARGHGAARDEGGSRIELDPRQVRSLFQGADRVQQADFIQILNRGRLRMVPLADVLYAVG